MFAAPSELGTDFRRLWVGQAISQIGSAVSSVAVPIVAVTILKVDVLQMTALTLISTLTVSLLALPLGAYIEFRHKRPIMIIADLLRFASAASVFSVILTDHLTFIHLAVASAISALGQLTFSAAAQANLVHLVSRENLPEANGRLQSTNWAALSLGPFFGGAVTGLLGAASAFLVDALSFVASALSVKIIKTPEPEPQAKSSSSRWAIALGGFRWLVHEEQTRRQLASWVLFAGAVSLSTPLTTLWYLNSLHFTSYEYGVILGLGSVGGVLGSFVVGRTARRFGQVATLRIASLLRAPWPFVIPLISPGVPGVAVATLCFGALLFFSSISNALMTSIRQAMTPDDLLTRVASAWQVATTSCQPLMVAAGGVLAAGIGVRNALFVDAALILIASLMVLRVRLVSFDPSLSSK